MCKKLFTLLFLFALSFSGRAAVVITDLAPDSVKTLSGTGSSWFPIDMNKDGIEDFNIRWQTTGGRFGTTSFYCYGPAANGLMVETLSATAKAADSGELISNKRSWQTADIAAAFPVSMVRFTDAGDKFIGVRFLIGADTNYGWISISYTSSFELTIMSFGYETTKETSIYTPTSPPAVIRPAAGFTSGSTLTDITTPITFTDTSKNTPSSWEWTFTPATVTFIGGTSASAQHPQVRFGAAGKYSVKLKATNTAGSDSITKTDYITVIAKPGANFSATPVSTDTKTTVVFSDLSTNTPTKWAWKFTPATVTYMSGTNATSQHPQVQFSKAGKYTVKLKASNAAGDDSLTKTNYINVDIPVGISNYTLGDASISIFPNPASTFLSIQSTAVTGSIMILDVTGKTEWTGIITDKKMQIDISGLPKGLHILRITNQDEVVNHNLITQ